MNVFSVASNGLNQAQVALESTANRIGGSGGSAAQVDSTSLSNNAVDLIQAKNDFAANIGVIRTADELARSTIDLLA